MGRGGTSWAALAAMAIVAVGIIVAMIGPSAIMAPWDVFILLDGGWRILNGHVPHRDFYNPIGPLAYWLTALGMTISGPSLKAYVSGNLIFLAVLAPWASIVFFRKLPGFWAFLMTVFIVLLITATHPLGYSPSTTTYAMIYNRYGWALSCVLMVQIFLTDRTTDQRTASFDAISAGLLLGLIFICKVTFFVVGLGAIVFACILRPDLRRAAWQVPIAFLLVCGAMWAVGALSPHDYVEDIAFATKSQSLGMRFLWLKTSLTANILSALLFAAAWAILVGWPFLRGRVALPFVVRTTLIFGFIAGSALALVVGNSNASEGRDVPLFLVAGVVLLELVRREGIPALDRVWPTSAQAPYGAVAVAFVVVFFASMAGKGALSLAHSYGMKEDTAAGVSRQRFDAAPLADFSIPQHSDWQTAYSRAGDVPMRINDGLALLRRHVTSDSRILLLALTDPFSFALNLRPATGAPLWWDLGISFNRKSFPEPEVVFAEADFVVHPSLQSRDGCCQDTVTALLDIYGDYLAENFVEAGTSAHWRLLRRRTPVMSGTSQRSPPDNAL